ncbi:sigma-54 dependent transcriptional regulator [Danxiaibacter flavus]|uniref:Sigma-54 dependent transcriptional regulator n=1 Tax=Danxiaibacter flavus TaxID=3049108 RepID=A0ABV3ZKE7_9BACT|nr:sigma-54 dependent transcriptional regulator [Chitinophagaceae bacterium DXS]
MSLGKILIVEDEFIVANDLRIMLMRAGYTVCGIASSVEGARKLIDAKKPDWVLLDITLKTALSGIELGKELSEQKKPFLYISANTSQATLEEAKTTQPYGFLVKPFREKDLLVMLDIARYRYGIETGSILTRNATDSRNIDFSEIIGRGPAVMKALSKVKTVAPTNTSVLLLGESGTGKERFAQAIHRNSNRQNNVLVIVNCAALPVSLLESELFGHEKGAFTGANTRRTGKFQLADGGTIFLDEIGELPLEAQVKLLRVLQEKEVQRLGGNTTEKVDVRIVAATNRNLEKEVADGRFRLDLYYRLNVFPIELPPLRERKEDIEPLVQHFLAKFSKAAGRPQPRVNSEVMDALIEYQWPGNIRELEHMVERLVLLAEEDEVKHVELPVHLDNKMPTSMLETMEEMERNHIMRALTLAKGKVAGKGGAAELLDMPVQTVYSKMKRLGITAAYK